MAPLLSSDTKVLLGCALGVFVAAIEGTVIGTVMPVIVDDLGGISRYGWVFAVYMMATASTMPVWGKLADQYGARPVFAASVTLFGLASVLAGTSQTMDQLIVWRVIQGIGAGGLVSIPMTILGNHFPPIKRGHALGIASSTWGFASIVGPPIGAWIVTALAWPWVFWLNLPVGAVAVALVWRNYHGRPSDARRHHTLDSAGAITIMATVTSLLFAAQAYKDATPLFGLDATAWLLSAIVLATAFVLIERRATEPIVPLDLFGHRLYLVANGGAFLLSACIFTAVAYIPLLISRADPDNVLRIGLTLIPLSLGWTAGSFIGGRVVARVGGRFLGRLGGASIVTGFVLATQIRPDASLAYLIPTMFLIGAGMGTTSPGILVSLQNHIGEGRMGVITSGVFFYRQLGGALGVTLLGALVPGADASLDELTHGIQHVFMAAAVIAFGGFVLFNFLPRHAFPAGPVPTVRPPGAVP